MTQRSNARLIYSTDTGGKCPLCGWPQRDCQCSSRREAAEAIPARVVAQLAIGLGAGIVATQLFDRLFTDPADSVTRAGMTDPAALSLIVLAIGAIAVLACVPPIRRATRVDPIVALRVE